jgi:hypothetical protein
VSLVDAKMEKGGKSNGTVSATDAKPSAITLSKIIRRVQFKKDSHA